MGYSESLVSPQEQGVHVFQENIHAIRYRVYEELHNMGRLLNLCVSEYPLKTIYSEVECLLSEISDLYLRERIDPYQQVNCSSLDSFQSKEKHKMRIGIFPVDANPIHWGHIYIGLSAMTRLSLDKVVFIVSGAKEQKLDMVQPVVRNAMARSVLKNFYPLLDHSDVGLGYAFDDVTNFFRFLELNRDQELDAVYISGLDNMSEHIQNGNTDICNFTPDNGSWKNNKNPHNIETAIIPRQSQPFDVSKCRNFVVLPEVPFTVSSTMIREVFLDEENQTVLSYLPYTAYVDIRAFGLYGNKFSSVSSRSAMKSTETWAMETV